METGINDGEELNGDKFESQECPGLHLLRANIECVVKKTVNAVSSQDVLEIVQSSCVEKNINDQQKKYITRLYSKFQELMEEVMKNEIDEFIEKFEIQKALESISKVLPLCSSPTSTWRPSGNPHQDLRSHEVESEIKLEKRLHKLIQEQEAKIQCLKQQIRHRRSVAYDLMKSLLVLKEHCSTSFSNDSKLPHLFDDMAKALGE